MGRIFRKNGCQCEGMPEENSGNARLTFDELATLLAEIECTLNSRPLTYEYNEVGEEVLTPSHLIMADASKHFQTKLLNQTMPLISTIALQDLSISALG